jgi:hypothetical protein
MNRSWSLRSAVALTALLMSCTNGLPAYSSIVRYSWRGQLVPNDVSNNPWQISQAGQDFELTIVISRQALDLSDQEVESATFSVSRAHLTLGGQKISAGAGSILDFADDAAGAYDLISFIGGFDGYGHAIEFGSNVALPSNSFKFMQPIEPVPFFASIASATRSAYGPQGPYTGVVLSSTPVLVAPEADPVAQLAFAALPILLVTLRSRYQLS